jgi:hypothetical protein
VALIESAAQLPTMQAGTIGTCPTSAMSPQHARSTTRSERAAGTCASRRSAFGGAASLRAQFMWRLQLWRGVDLLTRFEDSGLPQQGLAVGRPK